MNDHETACPRCGAYGTMQCSTVSGRDHKARWQAEEAAARKPTGGGQR